MTTFRIDDMTCSHCVGTITQALQALDPGVLVHVDLAAHQVEIGSTHIAAAALSATISEAGYTPLEIPTQRAFAPATDSARSGGGCCCGGGGGCR
jgi:copper chaperone